MEVEWDILMKSEILFPRDDTSPALILPSKGKNVDLSDLILGYRSSEENEYVRQPYHTHHPDIRDYQHI